ncbi:MAG: hypothetical protein WD066_07555 [Planctomycetaceae bacterium]
MTASAARRIVVDTDIAHAAGESGDARSIACRRFLEVMRDVRHHLATSREVFDEYREHQSRFFKKWLRSMFSRKLHARVEPGSVEDIRTALEQLDVLSRDRQATIKDLHVVATAFEADRLVASMDETARRCFSAATVTAARLKEIAWVNPTLEADEPVEWLEAGAKNEHFRRLESGR